MYECYSGRKLQDNLRSRAGLATACEYKPLCITLTRLIILPATSLIRACMIAVARWPNLTFLLLLGTFTPPDAISRSHDGNLSFFGFHSLCRCR